MKRSLLAVLVVLSTALALAAPTLIARVLTVTPVQAAIVDRQLRPGATVTVVNTGADGRQVSRFDADGAALTAHPDLAVVAGHTYLLRPHSAATTGCYGWGTTTPGRTRRASSRTAPTVTRRSPTRPDGTSSSAPT